MSTASSELKAVCYEFGDFRLLPSERLLLCEGQPMSLPPKVFDALVVLVESEGRLVEKNDLLERLWPETFVEEATLARTISSIRKALGEGAQENKYIETVPKRGYRFAAPVRCVTEKELAAVVVQPADTSLMGQAVEPSLVRDEPPSLADQGGSNLKNRELNFSLVGLIYFSSVELILGC